MADRRRGFRPAPLIMETTPSILMLLGEMRADQTEGARQRTAIFATLERIERCLSLQRSEIATIRLSVEQAKSDQLAIRASLDRDVYPTLADYRANKNRILGVLLAISAATGAVSSFLTNIISTKP